MSKPRQARDIPGRGQISLGARFVVLALVALALMIVDHRQDHLRRVHELLSLAVYPIHVVVDMPFSTFNALRESMTDRRTLAAENDRLALELMMSRVRLQEFESLVRENERLRELLNAMDPAEDPDIGIAEILKVDLVNRQRFVINRGRADGVYVGQPLLDARGIVGQIRAVSRLTSEAMLITDANHAVPVAVQRTGLRTIAEGTGDSGLLRLPYLPISADVVPGDLLVTSGLGGVFPRGRPVAEVVDVIKPPGQSFAMVTARPVSALDRDQEVLLVWNVDSTALDEVDFEETALNLSGAAVP